VFAALFLALATGVAFRLWNLPAQVMGEDEINTVRSALVNPTSRILVTYQRQDNTIPLTALYRFLLDRGIKLTEMMVRMPAVLSGLALLLLAPWWVARRLGLGTAVVYAALLAISPGLVFYSRIARSYAPIVLFGFGALVTFEAWWRRPEDWRRGAAYVLLAALAAWFHLGAAPFVVSPFLFAAGDLLVRRAFRRLKPVVLLWLATVAAFLAFLLPARETLVALLKEKHGDEILVTKGLVLDVLKLQAGSGQGWLAVLFLLAAVLGLVRLFLWDSHLAALSAMAVLGQGAALLYLAPPGHEHPLISFRYLLIGLPWVLVWVAAALSPYAPARSSSSSPSFGQPNSSGKGKKNKQLFNLPSQGTRGYGRRAGGEWQAAFVAVVLLVALVLAGPFMDRRLWRSPFAHHNDFMTFMWPRPTMLPKQAPNFYTELATSKGRGAVLEYPWMHVGRMNRAFYLYQEIHGRDVVVAPARSPLADDRLAFLNMVPGTPEGFLASRARWLVVHRNLVLEETRIPPRMPVQRRFRQLFSTYGQQTIAHLTRDWGKPDRSDQWVAVWDLERVRRKTPPALKPP
jgi:hypothetical protein